MNSFKNKLILVTLITSGLFISSCSDYLDINQDPNQSTISDKDLQLSGAELYIAVGFGERLFPNMGIWCQYHTGGPGVSLGEIDQNQFSSSEGNEIFRNVYRASNNLNYVIKNSPNEKNYVAISKILKAYSIQTCVDLFGNLPYTDALKGDISDGSIINPSYDNAKDVIYPKLATELIDAITLIKDGSGFSKPGANDLIYSGNMDNWSKFANTILLKLYLRSGKTEEAKALIASGASFITTNSEASMVRFPGGSTGSNPFYTAAKSTALGNFYVATTTSINYLTNTKDPRINYIYDQPDGNAAHKGSKPGDVENGPTNASTLSKPAGAQKTGGGLMFNPTMPVLFATAWEGNLLLAEAAALGLGGVAKDNYEAAVKEHFAFLGVTVSDSAYLANGGAFDANNMMKSIALQKWVCMNGLQPIESWIETRRMDNDGNKVFTSEGGIFEIPTKNALGGRIFPSILPYPESEESLNSSFPGQHPITAKLFWDK